ncbi:MAG: hypothetical protein VYE77_06965 [Planctomycetota bacterium]|nr:hypothetical protein [Planctomycetota bacterium]
MTATPTFAAGLALALLTAGLPAQQQEPEADPTLVLASEFLATLAPAEDDPDVVARRLLETAFRHPSSPAAGQLAQRAEQMLAGLTDPEALHDWLTDHPVQETAHGLLAWRVARIDLALRRRLELPLPRDPFPEFAREVQVIGPFGDPGRQWLDVIFAPDLLFPTKEQQLSGRFGPVTVRTVNRKADTEALRLQPADQEQPGCYFVRWTVEASEAVAGFLEVRYRGSVSARVDGVEVGRRDPATKSVAPQQRFAVRLDPGTHEVVIKTGDRSTANLALRFIDATGRPLEGVTEAVALPNSSGTSSSDPRDAGRFRTSLQEFRQAIARHGSTDRNRLLAVTAWIAQADNETDQVLELLAPLEDESVQEPLAQLTLANVLRSCRSLPNERRVSRARAFEEQAIAALPPTHYAATRARIRHLSDADKREEALAIMQQAVDEGRAGPNTFMRMLTTLRRLRFTAEIPALLNQWAETRPNDPTPHLELSQQALELHDKHGALEHARRALAASPDNLQALQQVYQLSLDLGRFDLAHEMVVRNDPRIGEEPATLRRLRGEINIATRRGDTEQLRKLLTELSQHKDAGPATHALVAGNLLRMGLDDEALQLIDLSLRERQDQPELRQTRERLGGPPAPGADFAKYRHDGDQAIRAFEPGAAEEASSTTVLIDQRIVELLPDGSAYTEVHELRRINDLQGVEAMRTASQPAQASDLLLLRTIGTDGRSYSPTRVDESFSMTRLEPGAFVEWRYRDHSGTQLGEALRLEDFLFASRSEPLGLSEYVLIVPPDMRGELRTRNLGDSVRTETLEDGRQVSIITRRSVPRLPVENSPPPADESIPMAAYGEDASPWPSLRGMRYGHLRRTRPTQPIQQLCDTLLADVEGDAAQLVRIHEFCQSEISPGSADDATQVLLRKQGNRLLLATALLRAAGIPFDFAAAQTVRPEMQSDGDPMFALEDPARLPALRVRPRDAQPLWLFADAPRYWPLGKIPAQRSGALAFLIEPSQAIQTRLPTSDTAQQTLRVQARCQVEPARVRVEAALDVGDVTGFRLAEQLRESTADRQEMAARNIGQQIFPDFRMHSAELAGLDPPGRPLRLALQLDHASPQPSSDNQWLISLPMPMLQMRRSFGDRDERLQPLRIEQDIDYHTLVRLDPGADRAVTDLPQPCLRSFGPMDYQLTFTMDGQELVIERRFRLRPGTIPTATYSDWIRILAEIDRTEQRKLVLQSR